MHCKTSFYKKLSLANTQIIAMRNLVSVVQIFYALIWQCQYLHFGQESLTYNILPAGLFSLGY